MIYDIHRYDTLGEITRTTPYIVTLLSLIGFIHFNSECSKQDDSSYPNMSANHPLFLLVFGYGALFMFYALYVATEAL